MLRIPEETSWELKEDSTKYVFVSEERLAREDSKQQLKEQDLFKATDLHW